MKRPLAIGALLLTLAACQTGGRMALKILSTPIIDLAHIQVAVWLEADEAYSISAFGLDVGFDEDKLEFNRIERGYMLLDWAGVDANLLGPGVLRMGGFAGGADPIEGVGSGTIGLLLLLHFNVIAPGDCTLSFYNYVDGLAGFVPQPLLLNISEENMNKTEVLSELAALFYAVGTPAEAAPQARPDLFLTFYEVECFNKFENSISPKLVTFWVYKEGEATEKAFWHGDEPNNFLRRLAEYIADRRAAEQIVTAYRLETNSKERTAKILVILDPGGGADYVQETHHLEYDPATDTWTRKKIA